mgnify:CR=1 FL=1
MAFKKYAIYVSILSLVACQPFKAHEKKNIASQQVVFPATPTIKIDANCMNDEAYNACLFLKNPVYQKNGISANADDTPTSLLSLQTVALKLSVRNNGPSLENEIVSVHTNIGTRAQSATNLWKFDASATDESDKFGQVMTYFWLTYAALKTQNQVGLFWAINKDIQVIINDEFSGWSGDDNTIHLQKVENDKHLTHQADLIIYYLGLANAHHATSGQMTSPKTDEKHRDCGKTVTKNKHCCVTAAGCSMALTTGAADYFVATIFPDAPTVGDGWTGRTQGLQACGISRDLNQNKDLTAQAAFSACSSDSGEGFIYPMGTVYASIWWEVRKKAVPEEIDRLYQNHLKRLNSTDDFSSALQKILSTDDELFAGKHKALFNEEFQRRGVGI